MISTQIIDDKLCVDIDTSLYSDAVITKVCYWLTDTHTLLRENVSENIQRLTIDLKTKESDKTYFDDLVFKISQSFADYKLREIVLRETEAVRNILYVKAFANSDEFEDHNLDL